MRCAPFAIIVFLLLGGCQRRPSSHEGVAEAASATAKPRPQPTSAYVESLRAKLGPELTLEPRLQNAAETALRAVGKPGAIVALEPETGTMRAVFSVPGERGDPLLTAHVPASTFKTFSAIAGLEAGALSATTEKVCTGRFRFAGKELRCAGVHGRETLARAITVSCNSYFYEVALEVDHRRILEVARRFGFGKRTGIELSDEAGHVPDDTRALEIERDTGSTIPLLDSAGHGEITVTLLQLARAFAAIANGGKLLRLGLTRSGSVERRIELRPTDLALVRGALVDVVAKPEGTAHAFAIEGFPFAAKTGSAEAPALNGVEGDDTWFVAYAPPNEAKILVAARVERADVARNAKLAVKRVLEAWRTL